MFRRLFATLALGAAAICGAAQAQMPAAPPTTFTAGPSNTGHLTAELVAQTTSVAPGGTAYVAIRQSIQKNWHTYWRNPGDSGEATSAKWTLPKGWTVGETVWPAPERLPLGPLMNYGYVGDVLLPVALEIPASAKPGSTQVLQADVTFLVCSDICVPEQAKLKLSLPVSGGTPTPDPKWGAAITKTLADAPKASGLLAATAWAGPADDRVLHLGIVGDMLKGADLSHAYFFPYDNKSLDHAAHQNVERGASGLTLSLKPQSGEAASKPAPTMLGVLSLGAQAWEVSAAPGAIPAAAMGQGEVVTAKPVDHLAAAGAAASDSSPVPAQGAGLGLPLAILSAFLGGLILNLMPCVFPVLSMKAASLASHAHDPRETRSQGLAFLAGVMATFLGLAALLLAAKAGGAAIGWGFQLQSPIVVGALALIMLLVALNLSGVFEANLPGQNTGGALASKGGLVGSFFTGALAVIVAAPCTAPFMATALGFALTQSAPGALLVFAGLGLGFAAPFVAVAFIPGLLKRLPRPGAWMDTLRHVLAFPMYGTAAWLLWVFTLQAGSSALASLLAAAVLAGLFAWLIGTMQRSGKPLVPGVAAAITAVLAVALLVVGAKTMPPAPSAQTASAEPAGEKGGKEAPSEPYTPEKLAELRAAGKPVFVNFTAAWCVTCQVNERLALGGATVAKAISDTGTTYLKADWTNHDSAIAKMLAEHGRAGVPLYLVYGAGGGDPVVLPQLLTSGAVVAALQTAAKPKA